MVFGVDRHDEAFPIATQVRIGRLYVICIKPWREIPDIDDFRTLPEKLAFLATAGATV